MEEGGGRRKEGENDARLGVRRFAVALHRSVQIVREADTAAFHSYFLSPDFTFSFLLPASSFISTPSAKEDTAVSHF